MNLDDHVFLLLGGYLATGIYFCPVKDTRVVESSLRREDISFRQRITRLNASQACIDKALLSYTAPDSQDLTGFNLWAFGDVIFDVELVRIIGRCLCNNVECRRQVTLVK